MSAGSLSGFSSMAFECLLQPGPVDLSVGIPRQVLEAHPARWQHVGRHEARQLAPEYDRSHCPIRRAHVGAADQRAFETAGLDGHHGALAEVLDRVEGALDFTQLDPVAAALDLGVTAPEEVHEPFRIDAGPIAGSVDTLRPLIPAWLGDERRVGPRGVPPVSRAQPHATDLEGAR